MVVTGMVAKCVVVLVTSLGGLRELQWSYYLITVYCSSIVLEHFSPVPCWDPRGEEIRKNYIK